MLTSRKAMSIIKSALPDLDGDVELVSRNKHAKLVVAHKGSIKSFFMSCSPSDHRGMMNFISDIRRWMRSINEKGNGNEQAILRK
jgi:hypothetical protein